MIVGILDKFLDKVVKTYSAGSINVQSGFSDPRFEYFEVAPGSFLDAYSWDGSSVVYDSSYQPPAEDPTLVVQKVIIDAMEFGNKILIEFASQNILMGITQAGKTKKVSDYLADMTRYVQTGSLYEVINEIDSLKQAGIPADLSPFVTIERLDAFKAKIMGYLT